MKRKEQTVSIAYLAMYIALYVVLKYIGSFIPFFDMPNGGSVEIELIAVFIASYHLGWVKGLAVGLLSWLITIVLGFPMYFVHPVQIFLDYAGPLMACGMASLLWPFENLGKVGSVVTSIILGLGAFFGIRLSFGTEILPTVCAVTAALVIGAGSFYYLGTKRQFGIVISMLIKYIFTVLSGAYYWADGTAAGSMEAWTFSLSYNLGYNLMTMIVCILAVPLLIERLKAAGIAFKK